MKILQKRWTLTTGAAAVAVVAGLVASGAVADQPPRPPRHDVRETLAAVTAGKARRIPAADVHYSAWWKGCRFVIHVEKMATYETDNANITIHEAPPEPLETPAPCPVTREPTADEINEMKAEVDAMNDRHRPPGAPGLPAYVSDVPRTGEATPTPPIPARR